MTTYQPRVADEELRLRLQASGAVLIEGPKACGKTATARRRSASEVRLDTDPQVSALMNIDPALLLVGDTPRLLDEWQVHPAIWNHVRRAVDDRSAAGQFILTGSANPDQNIGRHSGAGRISRMRMRPMSLWEANRSTGEVSLSALLDGSPPTPSSAQSTDLRTVVEWLVVGGWPGLLDLGVPAATRAVRDYVQLLTDIDVPAVSGARRDPTRVSRLLRSLARNISQEASIKTLAADTAGADAAITRESVVDYLAVLDRLMVSEDQPAWSPAIRSRATLRQAPKRQFVDPSIAVAALGTNVESLMNDLETVGFLFESMVIRDLRVYSQPSGGAVSHYRDSYGKEVDAIVERGDGSWGAFEVKFGQGAVDAGAQSLLAFAADLDTIRTPAPTALTVITGWGYAYRRPDGVNVVPISVLKP